MPRLSLRRLWTTYKRLAIEDGIASSPRDRAIAQAAFYGGARGGHSAQTVHSRLPVMADSDGGYVPTAVPHGFQ